MKFRNVGKSGLRVSEIGLGGSNLGRFIPDSMSRAIIDSMLDLGVNFVDTADNYGNRGRSEELLGECLGARRKDIVLATKWGTAMDDAGKLAGNSRRYIMMAVEGSLRRLRTDWIDLYQIHHLDATPMEEIVRALDDLVRQGKVRYIGHSNLAAWQIADAQWLTRHLHASPFIASQSEYSLLNRKIEAEIVPALQAHGVGLLPILPLAAGMLTGRYRQGDPLPQDARLSQKGKAAGYRKDTIWPVVAKLEEFCGERGHTLLELAVNWLLSRGDVSSIIAGVSSPEQLRQNVAAVGWELTEEDLAEIDRITLV